MREEAQAVLKAGAWRPLPAASSAEALYETGEARGKALLAVSGIGRSAARATGRWLLEHHRPTAVLSLGFAGGLQPGLRPGELVVAERILSCRPGATSEARESAREETLVGDAVEADASLLERTLRSLGDMGIPHRVGVCLTATGPVAQPADKERLWRATGALAVDMESYWLAGVCREEGVPFLAVRVVLDPQEAPLPPFAVALGQAGGRLLRIVQVMLRPWRVPRLVALAGGLAAAKRSLAAFAAAFRACYHAEGHATEQARAYNRKGWS
jgi:adenosylhomocysteine nucleosidase